MKENPPKPFSRNRGLLKMDIPDKRDFASTPIKGLPKKKGLLKD